MELSPQQFEERKALTLEVFKAFADYCHQHDLRYYGAYGTALGAIRHKGFIPWDDDIDVYMPRPDYDRLIELYSKEPAANYDLLTLENTPNYYLTFAKFSLHHSTLIENRYTPCNIGIFVDIFPLDGVLEETAPEKCFQAKRLSTRFTSLSAKFDLQDFLSMLWKRKFRSFLSLSLLQIDRKIKRSKTLEQFHRLYATPCYEEATHVMNYNYPSIVKEYFPKQWLEETIEIPFEDTTICVFKEVHQYLEGLFGDYMTPPPIQEQVSNHSVYLYHPSKRL